MLVKKNDKIVCSFDYNLRNFRGCIFTFFSNSWVLRFLHNVMDTFDILPNSVEFNKKWLKGSVIFRWLSFMLEKNSVQYFQAPTELTLLSPRIHLYSYKHFSILSSFHLIETVSGEHFQLFRYITLLFQVKYQSCF